MIKIIMVFLIMSMGVLMLACGFGKNNVTSNANQANANVKSGPPAIEITAEALAKEWLANPAAADEKYKGKELSVSGEVEFVDVIEDKAFVHLFGVDVYGKAPGARVTCDTQTTADTKRLVYMTQEAQKMVNRETNGTAIKVPRPKVTIKGTYLHGTPPDRPNGDIDLQPCELMPLF
jgi:hypothetical protein